MSVLTQNHLILEHLKAGRSITPIDALNEYGCFRLGARVFDLRRDGWPIETTRETKNEKTYARYSLGPEGWPE